MVPKRFLVDEFIYEEYNGKDRTHSNSYNDPVKIENVRIDRARQFHRDSNEADIRAEATIYCYSESTRPFLSFKEQSRVTIDNKSFLIKTVREYSEPLKPKRAIYELDVV